eukprot:2287462-Rhodomonas_salina.1
MGVDLCLSDAVGPRKTGFPLILIVIPEVAMEPQLRRPRVPGYPGSRVPTVLLFLPIGNTTIFHDIVAGTRVGVLRGFRLASGHLPADLLGIPMGTCDSLLRALRHFVDNIHFFFSPNPTLVGAHLGTRVPGVRSRTRQGAKFESERWARARHSGGKRYN